MRGLILAAGAGSRLRPLTDDRPKAMVPLFGEPLLHRSIATLRAAGVGEVVVAAGHRADAISAPGCRIILNVHHARTNMVATLFCVLDQLDDDDDLIVAYGDIAFTQDVARSVIGCESGIAVAVDTGWRQLWSLRMDDPLADAETLKLDSKGNITELGRPARSYADIEAQYIGLVRVGREMLVPMRDIYERLSGQSHVKGEPFEQMYMTTFLQVLIDEGWVIRAVPIKHGWLEVDTVEDLQLYERLAAEGTLSPLFSP